MKITVTGFQGENRALHPKLIPENVGVSSLNQKPGRGDLRPWKAPLTVATVGPGRKSIYRMGRDVPSDTDYWLSWNTATSVVRGYNTAVNGERTYYTGSGTAKWTDTSKALGANPPTAFRELGVPAPTSAPAVAAAGGASATMETRFYCYTYVTDAGEESAPSPVSSALTMKADATVTVSSMAAVPSGAFGIASIRVYRTQATSVGAEFFFLREVAYNVLSTTDDSRALGELLATTTWIPAPGQPQGGAKNIAEPMLKSLTSLWNGMMAGISGQGIRFCEPYAPYAWPLAYEIVPADVTPVALATYGQTLVALTNGRPLVIMGGSPEAMDEQPVEFLQSCVSEHSAVGMGHGVAWASPDGLAYIGPSGPKLLTLGIMTREDWQLLRPETIIGAMYEGRYFGFYSPAVNVKKAFMFDPATSGLYFMDFGADAVYVDDLQDAMYLLDGDSIKRWDAGAALTATFKSKVFSPVNPIRSFARGRIIADSYPVTFKMWAGADPTPKCTLTVPSDAAFALPGGFYASDFQFELSGAGAVQFMAVAHSAEELMHE